MFLEEGVRIETCCQVYDLVRGVSSHNGEGKFCSVHKDLLSVLCIYDTVFPGSLERKFLNTFESPYSERSYKESTCITTHVAGWACWHVVTTNYSAKRTRTVLVLVITFVRPCPFCAVICRYLYSEATFTSLLNCDTSHARTFTTK